mgnify:CR=1 FL=1
MQLAESAALLRDRINEAVKTAIKSGNKARLGTLRLMTAALKDRELGIGQGAFLAGVVYTWGWRTQAVALWEIAAAQPGLAAGGVQVVGGFVQKKHVVAAHHQHGERELDARLAGDASLRAALGGKADVVLSDMAAPTIGHRRTDHLRTVALFEASLRLYRSLGLWEKLEPLSTPLQTKTKPSAAEEPGRLA